MAIKKHSSLKIVWGVVSCSVKLCTITNATLAQWGERSLSERTAQVLFPVRPDKTYTVFC